MTDKTVQVSGTMMALFGKTITGSGGRQRGCLDAREHAVSFGFSSVDENAQRMPSIQAVTNLYYKMDVVLSLR